MLGRPPEEPEQPLTENSLLEVLDGAVMMYSLSVHQQLGKVARERVLHSRAFRSLRARACVCDPTGTCATARLAAAGSMGA